MTDKIINGFEQMKTMREFTNTMRDFLETVEASNQFYLSKGDVTLIESTEKLKETVSVIEETEQMLIKFNKGKITLEELEAFRDRVAGMRP